MGEEVTYTTAYWRVKLALRLVMLAGLIIIWWGIGSLIADIIIWLGVEWVSVSTIGTITIGLGIVISTAMIDKMVDRLYPLHASLQKNE